MGIPLPLHLLIHFLLSLLAGIIVWRIWRRPFFAFLWAIIGGFLVDFDHFIDYFLAFGWSFNLFYFIKGFEFLKSGKLFVFFHGWEYIPILLFMAIILKNKAIKSVFLALSLALFFHLASDVFMDRVPPKSYSIIFRAKNNFNIEKLSYPERWEKHLRYKKIYGFE